MQNYITCFKIILKKIGLVSSIPMHVTRTENGFHYSKLQMWTQETATGPNGNYASLEVVEPSSQPRSRRQSEVAPQQPNRGSSPATKGPEAPTKIQQKLGGMIWLGLATDPCWNWLALPLTSPHPCKYGVKRGSAFCLLTQACRCSWSHLSPSSHAGPLGKHAKTVLSLLPQGKHAYSSVVEHRLPTAQHRMSTHGTQFISS